MIYTSYFGKINKFPSNFEPICIARWKPKWYNGKVFLALAPSSSLLNWWRASSKNSRNEKEYKDRYIKETLYGYEPKTIERIIKYIAGDKVPVLICFEKDGFCHRHIVSAWFRRNGIDCEEWNG